MTDLVGTFNDDSIKIVSKFSGLRWFLLFEDLYNGADSLQAKLAKNIDKTNQI